MTQPEALRLADLLEMGSIWQDQERAAAELRRLYELAMDQQGKIYALEMARSMQQKTAKLKRDAELRRLHEENQRCRDVCAATAEGWREDREALLDALKDIDKEFRKHGRQHWPEAVKARAAIAKAEENT